MGKPLWVKKGCKVLSARGRGCWENRKGMWGSKQAKGRTGHCAWVGGGPRNRPIAPCSGGVTCQRRHGAEVKRKKEKREKVK